MTLVAISALSVIAFVLAFSSLGVLPAAQSAMTRAGSAGRVMRDPDLSDEIKEREIQKAALGLLGSVFSIFTRSAGSLIAALIPVYLFAAFGGPKADAVFAYLSRWEVIVVASVLATGLMVLLSRRPARAKPGNAYSRMDRALHRLAFATPTLQLAASDVEDNVFGADIAEIADKPPVFITSLPRAGTTVVLNALHDLPSTATHLYRDMPFVMAPLMWSRLGGGFQKDATLSERAHGDGLQVGFDSPEAFEEVIWRAFWPDHFGADEITPWNATDTNDEAQEFFRRHFRKIAAVRGRPDARYVSKNNGNIARLDLIPALFPEAAIVVPLRDPAEHAASLHRQHLNFLDQHARDPFVKRYMRDIGHLEFGELHRPVNFEGFGALRTGFTPRDPSYWLAYWIAAMETVKPRADRLHLLPQEALGHAASTTMAALCDRIGLAPEGADFAAHFRPIAARADHTQFEPALLERARALYADLAARAAV